MAEAEASHVKSDRPQVTYSFRALQEFKDNLPRSVVPVVLTVLGTLAFQSGIVLFDYYSEKEQIVQQVNYEMNRDISWEQNTLMLRKAAISEFPTKHSKLIADFQNALPVMNSEKSAMFATRFRDAIDESNTSLGTLEGYTGLKSTLPQTWLAAQTELYSSDLEALQTALACVDMSVSSDGSKLECLHRIRKQLSRMQRALARVKSVNEASTANEAMFEADRTVRWNKGRHQIDKLFRKAGWALVGLSISLVAYVAVLGYFLKSEKTEINPPKSA